MNFKNCPKCNGDVYLEEDLMGTDIVCLQCGHRKAVAGKSPYTKMVSQTSWKDEKRKAPAQAA